ncbi:hypothetical protein JCGZ_13244 [Jatropha curcas]|uniref:Glycosyltransferase N-terminal domain-containing protein n=1 Tax=Jatropha curcas TaxID=180498 RepID=A0A067KKH9_JATCU|nr:hypothetical protein JCGZ_13244 [Jatropha curcas]
MATVRMPHVVCVPFPLQGHIFPMLKLAKLLHQKGFHVTFVNTEYNHQRIIDSRGSNALNGLSDFKFVTLPLPNPPSNSHTSLALTFLALREICRKSFPTLFRDLVMKLNDSSSSSNPPVTCLLSDAILSYTLELSDELQIPNVLLWNMGASGFLSFKHSRDQIKQFVACLKDPSNEGAANKNLDSVMEWIPGMKGAQVRDLSKFFKSKQQFGSMEDSSEGDLTRASKASAVIFHSFDALESEVLNDISPMFQKVYSIGPLQLLLDQIGNNRYNSMDCNLWNEEPECIKWLDSKKPSSVIYINFGSTTVMSNEQVVELAWGLANSTHNFFWVTRPDLIMGDSAILPPEFLVETKERGFLASWCPQEEVLNHPSVAGFITRCGWNSTVESISAGVPVICWPFFGEHFVNCRKSCNEWGVGIELSNNFQRNEVENLVSELMVGEKGQKLKSKAMEWKKVAEEAASSNGSSSLSLKNLVNEVLLLRN